VDLFEAVDAPILPDYNVEFTGQLVTGDENRTVIALDLPGYQDGAGQSTAWESALSSLKVFQSIGQNQARKNQGPKIIYPIEDVGGLKVKLCSRPLILAGEYQQVRIECGFAAEKLYFLGQTTFFDGYPLRGCLGEVIAHYTIHYQDGASQVIPLRNGYEMASASMIARTSRINPVAVNTQRVMILHLEEDWEVYQVGCLEVETDQGKVIDWIEFSRASDEFNPLLYGVSAIA
jgi:hypothetical protein